MLSTYVYKILPAISPMNRAAAYKIIADRTLTNDQIVAGLIDLTEPKTDMPGWANGFQPCAD